METTPFRLNHDPLYPDSTTIEIKMRTKKKKLDLRTEGSTTHKRDKAVLTNEVHNTIDQFFFFTNPTDVLANITSKDIWELLTEILNSPTAEFDYFFLNYSQNTNEIILFLLLLQPIIKYCSLKNQIQRIAHRYTARNKPSEEDTDHSSIDRDSNTSDTN